MKNGGRPVGESGRADRIVAAIFAVGLALSLLLVSRAQVGGDQLELLARGWLLVARGEWVPYGMGASAGGVVPGGLTAILVGAPLALWSNHRAPVLLILLTHVAAFLLLDRCLRGAVRRRERILFAVVYWLNPWRLLLSGFLWNPGYMLLVGAVHAWCCFRQREAGRFGASMALALTLALAIQINLSVALLGVATVGLLLFGLVRLRWSGVLAGGVVAIVPLVPWLAAVGSDPSIRPLSEGVVGRGLLQLPRAVNYWFRYASFYLPAKETRFDFTPSLESVPALLLRGLGDTVVKGLGAASFVVAVAANVWLWRRWRRRGCRWLLGPPPTWEPRGWLLRYVRITFLSALLLFALAPTTVMWWQPVPLVHAASLALALAAAALARRHLRWVRAGVAAWTVMAVVFALLLAFGGPRHRCGGRSNLVIPLRHDHPMLHDLGIHASCRVPIESWGWWPDVLPEPRPAPSPSL